MHDVLGIKKKLAKQAKVRGYEELNTWIKSITNHLYWSIDYSSEGGLRTAAFTSLFNHKQISMFMMVCVYMTLYGGNG